MLHVNTFADWYDIVEQRVASGWLPHLLTFMFYPLPGSDVAVQRQQARIVEQTYARHVTFVDRWPTRPGRQARLPVWICSPDFPGLKAERHSLRDATINDGQHVHAFAVAPPGSRLGDEPSAHFEREQERYIRHSGLARLHARPIEDNHRSVFGYATKAISRGRVTPESLIVLPRSVAEIRGSETKVGRNSSLFRTVK